MISKIELKTFKIYLMLKLFMCLRLELLELFKKNSLLKVPFFFQIFGNVFVVYIFFWIFKKNSIFFNRNCQVRKIRNKKNMLIGGKGV